MLQTLKNYSAKLLAGVFIMFAFVISGHSQASGDSAQVPAVETVSVPVLKNYPQLKVGVSVADVRQKLGKPRIDDADGLYYEISDDEIMQIRIDAEKNVRLISVTYSNGHASIPKFADIFAADEAEPAAKPDGSIYHLARYPEAGYWIAYSRTAGEKPSVTVTMQKL